MKKTAFMLAVLALTCTGASASITFKVDRHLPRPTRVKKDDLFTPEYIINGILGNEVPADKRRVLASGLHDGEFGGYGRNPFFKGMIDAFANHRAVVLSPDVIWQLICQGFACHINRNPEEMRHLFVDHDGKIDLLVESPEDLFSGKADWYGIVGDFATLISENTKDGVAELMAQPFSTTGPDELMASQVVLMKSMESYFQYIAHYIGCGIPYVTLTGTPQDWQSILDRTRQLEKYGLEWWVEELEPILEEFVKASEGQPDTDFWKSIVMEHHPRELRGPGCFIDMSTELDGWFLKFFPYDKNGRLPSKVRMTHDMLPEQVAVEFKYSVTDSVSGEVLSTTGMELRAGIMGMTFEKKWTAVPKIGWFVRVKETEDEILEELYSRDADGWDGLELRIDRVPEVLKKISHLESLTLEFTGKVELPEWMEGLDIDKLTVRGEMTPEEEASLKERFPNLQPKRP